MSRIALYLADANVNSVTLISVARRVEAAGHRIVTVASERNSAGGVRQRRVLRKLERRLRSGEFNLIVAVPPQPRGPAVAVPAPAPFSSPPTARRC